MEQKAWKPAESLDEVREEIRNAIFFTCFHLKAAEIDLSVGSKDIGIQKAIGFVEFGVRCGLITPDEGNDWLDVVWDRKTLLDVSQKYMME